MRRYLGIAFVVIAATLPAQQRLTTPDEGPVLRVETRLVEVHATVLDKRGRPVQGLSRESFAVLDSGLAQEVEIFEAEDSPLSLAILLDITGSMYEALPSIKSAAVGLIQQLRPGDSVAVFGFNQRVETLQDFTTDHKAAMLAVRRIRVIGRTALFDAVARVGSITARQNGKKVIVALTDGDDNASSLTRQRAVDCVKRHGIPLYLIAQGEAARNAKLMESLDEMGAQTGGHSFKAGSQRDLAEVFDAIAGDLKYSYMLAFRSRSGNTAWRPLKVTIANRRDLAVRCREGYYVD